MHPYKLGIGRCTQSGGQCLCRTQLVILLLLFLSRSLSLSLSISLPFLFSHTNAEAAPRLSWVHCPCMCHTHRARAQARFRLECMVASAHDCKMRLTVCCYCDEFPYEKYLACVTVLHEPLGGDSHCSEMGMQLWLTWHYQTVSVIGPPDYAGARDGADGLGESVKPSKSNARA